MQTIARDDAMVYELDPAAEPLLTVDQGESFKIETWDAFEGAIFENGAGSFTADNVPQLRTGPPGFQANPVGGRFMSRVLSPGMSSLSVSKRSLQNAATPQLSMASETLIRSKGGRNARAIRRIWSTSNPDRVERWPTVVPA
jgi:hypothetical protein